MTRTTPLDETTGKHTIAMDFGARNAFGGMVRSIAIGFVDNKTCDAALVIAYARRHREERRARTDLETLVDTSPVAVLVFNVRKRALGPYSREAGRIAGELVPGSPQRIRPSQRISLTVKWDTGSVTGRIGGG